MRILPSRTARISDDISDEVVNFRNDLNYKLIRIPFESDDKLFKLFRERRGAREW